MPHTLSAAFGIFASRKDVEKAVEMLRAENFSKKEISVLLPHQEDLGRLAHVADTHAVEGAEIGVAAGAVIGSVLGALAGVGLLAIPGVGTLIVLGPIATMLIATGASASVGGLWGGLIGLGIPEEQAHHFHKRIHKGDILLSVHCADHLRILRAEEIMIRTNAQDVYTRAPFDYAAVAK